MAEVENGLSPGQTVTQVDASSRKLNLRTDLHLRTDLRALLFST